MTNRPGKIFKSLALGVLLFGAGSLRAEPTASERWEKLPAAERERVLKNYERWKAMDGGRREEMQARWERFRSLDPARQEKIRER